MVTGGWWLVVGKNLREQRESFRPVTSHQPPATFFMKRTAFTRYRHGEAETLAITPAWLTVKQGRWSPNVESAPNVGQIRCRRTFDVRVGDVLSGDGRLFVCQQSQPEQSTQLLICSELDSIIPDEFESGLVNPFWSEAAPGTWSAKAGTSKLELTPPTGSDPSDAAWLAQEVSGDFDCVAWLSVTTGEALNIQWGLFGARVDDENGVYLALRDDGDGVQVVRLDVVAGVVHQTAIPMDAHWLRIKRTGKDFLVMYSANVLGLAAVADWVVLRPGGATLLSADDLTVGIGGYSTGAGLAMHCDVVRNYA